MPALFQLLRTRKKQDNEELNKRILKFGEPLYLHNDNKSDVALVIGDPNGTLIKDLPKFTPVPPAKDNNEFNNIYFIKEGDKYYLVDKDGNKIDVIGGGGGGLISTYTATLTVNDWVPDTTVEGVYKQDVALSAIQEKNPTTIDVKLETISQYENILANWRYIIKAQTYDGGIIFYAYEKPKRDLVFQAQTISNQNEILVEKTATINHNWTQLENYYWTEVVVEGVKSINASTIDLIVDLANFKEQLQQWNRIIRIDTEEGKIKVYASKPTTIDLPINMFVYTLAETT